MPYISCRGSITVDQGRTKPQLTETNEARGNEATTNNNNNHRQRIRAIRPWLVLAKGNAYVNENHRVTSASLELKIKYLVKYSPPIATGIRQNVFLSIK